MRLFFACWPPAGTAQALAAWARAAQRECGGRAVPAQNIHLTLAFLGEADPAAARVLGASMRMAPTRFVIEEARFWAHNRILWAGPRETPPALAALARALGEKRELAAHVTLVRHARHGRRLPPLAALDWPVGEFSLVSSTLGPAGPGYEVLARYALG
jgi:2'-5' RNA ligase